MKKQGKSTIKITKKIQEELIIFNRTYRKPKNEKPLTIEEYTRYLYGKGLPATKVVKERKQLKSFDIPVWAKNVYDIPSAASTNHIAVKNSIMERLSNESEETRTEIINKKNRIALPYSKGAYQYITDADLAKCLGRKL
jgi:hypothetical protein